MGADKIEEVEGSAETARFKAWHLALLCCAILYFGPITQTYPEQDSCSFGSVTNEEYLAMLREAKKDAFVLLIKMNAFSTTNQRTRYDHTRFDAYFRKHVQSSDNVEKMVAGMHAAMRAIGAWHIESSFKYRKKPYAGRDFGASFTYGIVAQDLRELRFWDLIFRYAKVLSSIRRDVGSSLFYLSPPNAAGVSFVSLKNLPRVGEKKPKQPCPVVPR